MKWRTRLNKLKRGEDGDLLQETQKLSGDWTSCAIGENRDKLKAKGRKFLRITDGPMANDLRDLGLDFDDQVQEQNWPQALEVLGQIEKEAAS